MLYKKKMITFYIRMLYTKIYIFCVTVIYISYFNTFILSYVLI